MTWHRHSRRVTRGQRWAALRLQALRRDRWACVKCRARGRLEVDHIKPVRTHPELAYELSNLQCLCPRCHSGKTRREVGLPEPDPEREKWQKLLKSGESRRLTVRVAF